MTRYGNLKVTKMSARRIALLNLRLLRLSSLNVDSFLHASLPQTLLQSNISVSCDIRNVCLFSIADRKQRRGGFSK